MAKNTEPTYVPPFTITDEITTLVAEIAEKVGHLTASAEQLPTPQLRRENRIKTIQSSLAIENNSLSLDQVTAIVEGKRVLGAPNEIQEVKNAIDAYELMLELDPYKEKDMLKAHKLMMTDLVAECGRFRTGGVGVFNGEVCIHMAPPAQRVPLLIGELLDWVKTTKTHPLISSCVFHYEFEFIHPFADGNGRMGRMWQTLLLMQWKPIFAWIPVETIVKEHQQEYYAAIMKSDHEASSTPFIVFMLGCLKEALDEMVKSNQKSNQKSDQKIISAMRDNPVVTIKDLQAITGLSESGVKKIIRQLRADGIIERVGAAKGGHWEVIQTI
ncbi:MAG: Fic family protein [Bacteroidales bacterium]|nr:Fic family protein [Bacteroidales bacterium]